MTEQPRCGRATRSGTACRQATNRAYGPVPLACGRHRTAGEAFLEASCVAAHQRGYQEGATSTKREVEQLRNALAQARQDLRQTRVRLTDGHGRQIIECGRYAYVWTGDEPLVVGDKVWLPGNWLAANEWLAEVTGLGTTYDGALSTVLRRG